MLSKLFRYLRFGITRKKIAAVLLIWAGLSISPVTWAAGFPNAGVDDVLSLSTFKMTFTEEFAFYLKEVKGVPFCEGFSTPEKCPQSARVYTSPTLYDPNTKIGRSDPHQDGNGTDEVWGADVCKNGTTNSCQAFSSEPVLDTHFQWRDTYEVDGHPFDEGPNGVEEVHTQILSLRLTPTTSNSTTTVRAGDPAPCQARSLGEIESLNGDGFPAESFFHMYVEFDIDLDNNGTVDMVLFNEAGFGGEPLVFESTGLTSFPPEVIYSLTGTGSSAPRLYLRGGEDCQLDPVFSEHIGWLRIMSFGVNFGAKLTVDKAGTGTGNVTGQYIDCNSDCTEKTKVYVPNTQVSLTATADAGSTFTGWDTCSGTGDCTVTMDQNKTVTATFHLPTVSLVSPLTATLNELTIFTVKGNYLTADTAFWIGQCEGLIQLSGGTETQRQFQCTPSWSTGTKDGVVKNKSGGTVLRDFKVTVVEPQQTTFPLITNKNGTGTGKITGQGINCSSDCSEEYIENTQVSLTANPPADSIFAGWSGAGCSGTGNCTVTMNQVQNVTATFNLIPPNTLKVTIQAKGTVTSSPSGINCSSDCSWNYKANTSVTLTAKADSDYTFVGWGGACSGTGNCSVTMNQAQNVTATFEPKPVLLTINKTGNGNGTVTSSLSGINCGSDCSWNYKAKTSVTLTATPDADSIFTGWSGACSGTGNCTVTMNQAQNVIATFEPKPIDKFLLTISEKGNGNGIVTSSPSGINCGSGGNDCGEEYDNSPVITLKAKADADSIFEGWGGACIESGDAASCVVKMSSDKTVTASFDLCKYTVKPTNQTHKFNADNGSITVEVSNNKCPWAAISHNDDWLKITSPKDNHGNGKIDYSVADNSNTADREGTLTIAGQKVTIYQGIYEKPIASFTATPLSGMAPLTVKLDASDSDDPDGEIESYEWATSDEQTASGKIAELTFAGDKSCHPTITLTVTDNDGLSDQTEKTISIENCAIVEFQGIEDYYRVGDFVRAEVKIDVNVGRFKRVDLWVAVSIPSGDLIFRTPFGINAFSPNPQAFKESLESQTVNHRLLDFEVPRGLGGTYIFYALIVDEGEEPMEHLDELVVQTAVLE